MKKPSILLLSLVALIPIITNWTCPKCDKDNPEERKNCWWCGYIR